MLHFIKSEKLYSLLDNFLFSSQKEGHLLLI